MKNSRLATWQITLVLLASIMILGPVVWDILAGVFTSLQDVELAELFTRDGAFVIGFFMLIIVGIYEIYEDFRDKPKSKHIK